jgi:PAS domain S-box-containing protein
MLWNHSLRRKVTQKTVQLQAAIDALGKSEEKYRLVVENADEAILIAQGGFLKYVNPITIKMLGYSEEVLTSMPFVELIHPEDREKLFEAHIRIMKGEENQPVYQFRIFTSDGTVRWADSRAVTISWEGKPATLNFITDVTERKKADEERQQGIERIRKALGATVQAMAMTVEARDPYTAGHQHRVSDLARAIATEMALPGNQIDGLRMASMIHDIGKISVPAEILSKPTKLSVIEFSLIKIHSQSGYDILKNIDFPWPIARIVLEHHERQDGSGYPNGLTGDKLLMESRILAVADVVESISSHRPYRPSLGLDAALQEIANNRCILYDSVVVDICLRLFNEKGYKVVD